MSSKRKSQKPKLVSSLIKPRGRCSGMWFIIYIFVVVIDMEQILGIIFVALDKLM